MTWDPTQYERFKDERSRPFFDLLALVKPAPAMRVVDLGCGTGGLTFAMHQKLGARHTLGIDTSDAMLARAREHAAEGLRFERGDLATFAGAGFDLVFSNAAVHWVDDHAALLARLTACLAPGGQLAIQMPANHDYPTHSVAEAVAREEPFAAALGGYRARNAVLAPARYAEILHDLGYTQQHVRLQVYGHVLPSRDDVVEWVKGTTLTEIAGRLAPDLFAAYVARYRERLFEHLPDQRPFFYPFKRILFWAAR